MDQLGELIGMTPSAPAAGGAAPASTTTTPPDAGPSAIDTFKDFLPAGMAIAEGIAKKNAGDANAKYAKEEGRQAVLAAAEEAARMRRRVAMQQSTLRAINGAQGTTFSGSPMEVYLENAKQGELMSQDLIYKGQLKRYGSQRQASIYSSTGKAALLGGLVGAVGKGYEPTKKLLADFKWPWE